MRGETSEKIWAAALTTPPVVAFTVIPLPLSLPSGLGPFSAALGDGRRQSNTGVADRDRVAPAGAAQAGRQFQMAAPLS